ncbi:MAG: hypothetical protein PHF57_14120, partial [Methanoregula sp.]|nr:hypothetical protein [Methanoregula sp.]
MNGDIRRILFFFAISNFSLTLCSCPLVFLGTVVSGISLNRLPIASPDPFSRVTGDDSLHGRRIKRIFVLHQWSKKCTEPTQLLSKKCRYDPVYGPKNFSTVKNMEEYPPSYASSCVWSPAGRKDIF